MSRFVAEIFQDVDGGYSAKRTAFFIFVALLGAAFVMIAFRALDRAALETLRGAMAYLVDLIKWLGALIASEQMTKFAPHPPRATP